MTNNGHAKVMFFGQFLLLCFLAIYALSCFATKKQVEVILGNGQTTTISEYQAQKAISKAYDEYKKKEGKEPESMNDVAPYIDIDKDGKPDAFTGTKRVFTDATLASAETGISWLPAPFNSLGGLLLGLGSMVLAVASRRKTESIKILANEIGYKKGQNESIKDGILDKANRIIERLVPKFKKEALSKGSEPWWRKLLNIILSYAGTAIGR